MPHDFPSMLKELHLKVTPRRLATLAALATATTYVSPEEVHKRLQGEFARIGLPTVYRNLEELAAGGVITKVLHPNRQLYYYFCPNRSHHHHFVCLACRTVADLECCGLEEVEKQVGGRVLSHIVQANGLCQACLQAGREAAA